MAEAFIVGLSKMDEEGVSAIKTLDDIGIAEIRLRDTLLRATNDTELFNEAGWDTTAETLATNLETAINNAFIIHSPSERMKPEGEFIAAGVGAGMAEFDFSTDAATLAANIETAIQLALGNDVLSPAGTSAMDGLAASITSYERVLLYER
ncbi:MAG: hypothetical protein IJ153_07005 [Clostridia bacterium]|nr:hypothetical protein [Clostridia bacterium]